MYYIKRGNTMNRITCYSVDGSALKSLYQWDINQKIVIRGVDVGRTTIFHFHNNDGETTLSVEPSISGNDFIVNVPNILLQRSDPITVYMYQNTDDSGIRTVHKIHIPVIKRQMPSDYIYEDGDNTNVDFDLISTLIETGVINPICDIDNNILVEDDCIYIL